jgi:hypothetical protein
MIPGITANDARKSSSGTYSASAVAFGGTTTIVNSSLSSTDNNFVSFSGWFRPAATDLSGEGVPFVVDPSGHYYTNAQFVSGAKQFIFNPAGTGGQADLEYDTGGPNPTLVAGAWYHIIGSFDGTGSPPHGMQLYVNDVQANLFTVDASTDVIPKANGLPFWVGGDGPSNGDPFFGSIADFSFWPGVSFLESGDIVPLLTRRLFIDASGAPVHPSTAIATLGTPAVMLSGNASTFPSNSLGGSGAFTTTTGGLTNDFSVVHL